MERDWLLSAPTTSNRRVQHPSTSSTSVDDPVVRDSPTAAAGKGSCGGAVAGGVYNSPVEFQGLGRGWEGQWNDIGLDRAVVGGYQEAEVGR